MAKKWVNLGGLGRSRRQSNRSCGEEVTCFSLRAPRGFRADSLPKIYFREAPIDVPDVVASDTVAAGEVNAVKHASDVALSSPSNSHPRGPSSRSSADLSSFDLPNLESEEPSPANEPVAGRRGSPDGTQTCPERSLTGDDGEFGSRRAKTVPLDAHSAHSRRFGSRRSLTGQRGSEWIGDGTVTETTTPEQHALKLAPAAEPCSPAAAAGRPAPPVSAGLSRLMADLYGGEEDDSVAEGDLYGAAVLPASSSKSARRASISGGTGGFGGSSRRSAWEGAGGDDYISYPEDLYAVAFRSGPLPPSRSPAAFSRGGGGGGGGCAPARSPLSRNATMHMVPKPRSRRTFSQPSDFPGFHQDLTESSSAIGGGGFSRRSSTQPKLRAPYPDLAFAIDVRAGGGQAYPEASIPEAFTPESLCRGVSVRTPSGGSHRKGSFRGRPSEDLASRSTDDLTEIWNDSSRRGQGGQRRRGSASGGESGAGVKTPAEGHRRIPSGASYDGRDAGEIDDDWNGGGSREGFGSCAVTPRGGRVARRANVSPLTSPHPGASQASPLVSPHAGVDRVDLFQHYQHNRNPRGWTSPHISAQSVSGSQAPALNPLVEGEAQSNQARRRSIEWSSGRVCGSSALHEQQQQQPGVSVLFRACLIS
ncbi:unnamed protein product [Closterium sp. Yama58-4]|nr:unnamed protein product [Closterium sp. Yama58-4]